MMKYILELDSRTNELIEMENKHASVLHFLKNVTGDLGTRSVVAETPEFKRHFVAFFKLNKILGKGIKGDIMYRYRAKLSDHHSCDDRIWIEFLSTKVNFLYLTEYVIYEYIKGFDAYRAAIYPEAFIHYDHKIPFEIKSKINHRKNIKIFYPFQYLDEELVRRALGYNLNELEAKLNNRVHKVEQFNNGILIKAKNNYVTVEEAIEFNKQIQEILQIQMPAGEIG